MEPLSLFQDTQTRLSTSNVGIEGERLASAFLKREGYQLAAANFKVPVGRNMRGSVVTGEIDLIGYDGAILCFIEVKTRTSAEFAAPETAVNLRKQRQIIRTARMYRKIFRLRDVRYRYDVVSVILPAEERPAIEVLKGYWDEQRFRKNYWTDNS
jgi:putative endonuclease